MLNKTILATAALAALCVPAASFADHDGWQGDRGGWHEDWRGDGDRHDWREREWRQHEWREHNGYGWRPGAEVGFGYAPRCWTVNHGYYTWYGAYAYRPVRVCR